MGHDVLHDLEKLRRRRESHLHEPLTDSPRPAPAPSKIRLALQTIKLIREIRMKKASWKTTLGGVLIGAAPFLKNMLPDQWDWVGDALLTIGGIVLGTSARDNSVTSEQAGAKR